MRERQLEYFAHVLVRQMEIVTVLESEDDAGHEEEVSGNGTWTSDSDR